MSRILRSLPLLVLLAATAAAQTLVVTTTADSGPGSLRQAVIDANADPEVASIGFSDGSNGTTNFVNQPQTIALAGGELVVTSTILISAPDGSVGVTLSGNAASRIFRVTSDGVLSLSRLGLENGRAGLGGAIQVVDGTLQAIQCEFAFNSATSAGGALHLQGATTRLFGCTLRFNSSAGFGGAIYSDTELAPSERITTLLNTTVSSNTASGEGGGIYNHDGLLRLYHATVTGNNAAAGTASGLASYPDTATRSEFSNTIIAGNQQGDGRFDVGARGGITPPVNSIDLPTAHNLIGTLDALTEATLDPAAPLVIGTGPTGLDFLREQVGPTRHHPLLAGSPAIDAGTLLDFSSDPVLNVLNFFDQRGLRRLYGSAPDIGAVEFLPASSEPLVVRTSADPTSPSYDPASLSLREAIHLANANPDPTTIVFDPGLFSSLLAEAIELHRPLVVRSEVTIEGVDLPGAEEPVVRITGNSNGDDQLDPGEVQVLRVDDGESSTTPAVTLRRLTLRDGVLAGNTESPGGGIIDNNEDLTLEHCVVRGGLTIGDVTPGGGIHSGLRARLTVADSRIAGNRTLGRASRGGGIYGVPTGDPGDEGWVRIQRSSIEDNRTSGSSADGGGLFFNGDALEVGQSLFTGNQTLAPDAGGGGLASNSFDSPPARILHSTFSGNSSSQGGGIYLVDGLLALGHCTVTANTATSGSGIAARKYGLVGDAGVELVNTILCNNNGPDFDAVGTESNFPTVTDALGNLVGTGNLANTTFFPPIPGTVLGADAQLDPLRDNGGPTRSHLPRASSPAIDFATTGLSPAIDQRGLPRDLAGNPAHDSGAVETTASGTFTVNSALDRVDDNLADLSLREALLIAGSVPADAATPVVDFAGFFAQGAFTIEFDGEMVVTRSLEIHGPGRRLLTLSGGSDGDTTWQAGESRLFRVPTGVELTIRDATLADGIMPDPSSGGLVLNNGSLGLERCDLRGGRSSREGGAIVSRLGGAVLALIDCSLSDNHARGRGGAIFSDAGNTLVVQQSRFRDNLVDVPMATGGAIHHGLGGVGLVVQSTFDGNEVRGDDTRGGALAVVNNPEAFAVIQSTFSANTAAGGGATGGAVWVEATTAGIRHCTFTANTSPVDGGALACTNDPETSLVLQLDVLSGNDGPDVHLLGSHSPASISSAGHNLVGTLNNAAGIFGAVAGDQVGVGDPMLEALADNGAITPTHAPLDGSPVLDAGPPSFTPDPQLFNTRDQHGLPRVAGVIDIGAVERQIIPPIVSITADEFDDDFSFADLSLREAIAIANSGPGASTVSFSDGVAGTVDFTQPQTIALDADLGPLRITNETVIDAPGGRVVAISGNSNGDDVHDPGETPLLRIDDRDDTTSFLATLRNLDLKDGVSGIGSGFDPGGILHNREGLVLEGCGLSGGRAIRPGAFGGGLANFGSLEARWCSFRGNRAIGENAAGGAIACSGVSTIEDSAVEDNACEGPPGGGTIGTRGGGIHSSNVLILSRCAVTGNQATGAGATGGGISCSGLIALLSNSTLSGNATADGSGGGLHLNETGALLAHLTVHDNLSSGPGAGLAASTDAQGANVFLHSCIIAGNAGATAPRDLAGGANWNSAGFNVIGEAAGSFTAAHGDQLIGTASPLLAPLTGDGRHPLLAGSPAIDAGSPVQASFQLIDQLLGLPSSVDTTLDQVGNPRSRGLPDAGAIESPAAGLVSFSGDPLADSNGDGISDFQHFATGTDPNAPAYDPTAALAIAPDGAVTLHHRSNAEGLDLFFELSTNLVDFVEMIPPQSYRIRSVTPLGERVRIVLEPTGEPGGSQFIRGRWR